MARGDVVDVVVQEVDKARGRIGLKLIAKHENGTLVQPEELIERAKDAPPRPPEEERPRRDDRAVAAAAAVGARSDGDRPPVIRIRKEGRPLGRPFPESRALAIEAAVIAGLIVLVAFLVYHFTVHKIVNHRPLGGTNVDVSSATFDQSEAAFAIDPADAKRIFGASNDTGLEVVRLYESANGGARWTRKGGPAVSGGSCAHGAPSVAFGCERARVPRVPRRAVLRRLADAAPRRDDACDAGRARGSRSSGLRSRHGSTASTTRRASRSTRAPGACTSRGRAASRRRRRRSSSARAATRARHGAPPRRCRRRCGIRTMRRSRSRRTATCTSPGSTRSSASGSRARPTAGRRSWRRRRPQRCVRTLRRGCALTAQDPLPKELTGCAGPDPTIGVGKDRVYVVYGDVGANQTPDVYAVTLDRALKPVSRAQVNPVEKKKTQQFLPAAALDPTTGVLWACWYDTTFDENAHRAWFTCSGLARRAHLDGTAPRARPSRPRRTSSTARSAAQGSMRRSPPGRASRTCSGPTAA